MLISDPTAGRQGQNLGVRQADLLISAPKSRNRLRRGLPDFAHFVGQVLPRYLGVVLFVETAYRRQGQDLCVTFLGARLAD
jgi:hypothetical protein